MLKTRKLRRKKSNTIQINGDTRSWTGICNIVKTSVLPKLVYRISAICIKIVARFFEGINNIILKFMWKGTGTRTAKTILKKKKSRKNQST